MKLLSEASTKRIAISKASLQMVVVMSIASFITIFGLVAANYLWGLKGYQSKIISADQKADTILKSDVASENQLVNSYKYFVNQPTNVIGGNSSIAGGGNNGNNATIVLDALPSSYDFPALTTSIAKLLQSENLDIASIGGTDESATVSNAASSNPQPVSMPFSFEVNNADYTSIQNLLIEFERSIRPISIDSIDITGADSSMSVTVNAHTYFQPPKKFEIGSEVIK
jgi:hypothetical protein